MWETLRRQVRNEIYRLLGVEDPGWAVIEEIVIYLMSRGSSGEAIDSAAMKAAVYGAARAAFREYQASLVSGGIDKADGYKQGVEGEAGGEIEEMDFCLRLVGSFVVSTAVTPAGIDEHTDGMVVGCVYRPGGWQIIISWCLDPDKESHHHEEEELGIGELSRFITVPGWRLWDWGR